MSILIISIRENSRCRACSGSPCTRRSTRRRWRGWSRWRRWGGGPPWCCRCAPCCPSEVAFIHSEAHFIININTWSNKSRKDDSSTRIQIPTPSPAQDKTKIKKFVTNKSHLQQLLKKPIVEADAQILCRFYINFILSKKTLLNIYFNIHPINYEYLSLSSVNFISFTYSFIHSSLFIARNPLITGHKTNMTVTHKQEDTMSESCEEFADMTSPGSGGSRSLALISTLTHFAL